VFADDLRFSDQGQAGVTKKLIAVAEWIVEYAPQCDGCKETYSRKNPPEEPPCEICREEPFEENRDAVRIFSVIKNQLILGFGGPIDINHMAIHEAMKLYKIKNKRECFEKILRISGWWIKKLSEDKGK
jgi:hypothetical protein